MIPGGAFALVCVGCVRIVLRCVGFVRFGYFAYIPWCIFVEYPILKFYPVGYIIKAQTRNTTPPQKGHDTMRKFEIGKTYTIRCFGDHELTETWEVVSRTAKTLTIREPWEGTKKVRIKTNEEGEYANISSGFSMLRA